MAVFSGVLLLLAIAALWFVSARARELCVLSVRQGKLLVMRGSLPASLLEALGDIVARAATRRGTIRVLRGGESARLETAGLDEFAAQRARNVLGTYPMPRLLAAPAPVRRNLGQRLGVASLGWWMAERSSRRP